MEKHPKKLAKKIPGFLRQYARKHYPNWDPNDRAYDRRLEALLKRMSPQELDRLMHGDDAAE